MSSRIRNVASENVATPSELPDFEVYCEAVDLAAFALRRQVERARLEDQAQDRDD